MFPSMNSYSKGIKISKIGLMRNRDHGGSEKLSEV